MEVQTQTQVEEVKVDGTKAVDFDYLVISKTDFDAFSEGIESLNANVINYMKLLLNNKFFILPKPEGKIAETVANGAESKND